MVEIVGLIWGNIYRKPQKTMFLFVPVAYPRGFLGIVLGQEGDVDPLNISWMRWSQWCWIVVLPEPGKARRVLPWLCLAGFTAWSFAKSSVVGGVLNARERSWNWVILGLWENRIAWYNFSVLRHIGEHILHNIAARMGGPAGSVF